MEIFSGYQWMVIDTFKCCLVIFQVTLHFFTFHFSSISCCISGHFTCSFVNCRFELQSLYFCSASFFSQITTPWLLLYCIWYIHLPSPVSASAALEEQLRNIKVVKSEGRCSFEVIFMECMVLMCSLRLLFPPLSELICLHFPTIISNRNPSKSLWIKLLNVIWGSILDYNCLQKESFKKK